MVTPSEYYANGKYMGAEKYVGLQTDTKPVSCGNGSIFIEMDTSKLYFFDAVSGDWLEWGAENG